MSSLLESLSYPRWFLFSLITDSLRALPFFPFVGPTSIEYLFVRCLSPTKCHESKRQDKMALLTALSPWLIGTQLRKETLEKSLEGQNKKKFVARSHDSWEVSRGKTRLRGHCTGQSETSRAEVLQRLPGGANHSWPWRGFQGGFPDYAQWPFLLNDP